MDARESVETAHGRQRLLVSDFHAVFEARSPFCLPSSLIVAYHCRHSLAFGISLAFAILGLGGIIGTDDILCCFVAGCAVTWHSFYKDSTEAGKVPAYEVTERC